MHIMFLTLPIMLCSDSLPLALLLPIMPHYALKISLKIDTNGHYGTAVNSSVLVWCHSMVILYCGIVLECNVDFNKQIKQAE